MLYTAVIRTLGTAGEKYQRLLASLAQQTLRPQRIIAYIAEGYPCPPQSEAGEEYVYVKKGMAAQRALPYDEVQTEYILFLDDDLYLPHDTVEQMDQLLKENRADVIAPDIFPNAERPLRAELMMALSGRMRARRGGRKWGYKVMRTGGYSYNKKPGQGVLRSQTNAGACFLCSKKAFLSIHFEEELWLDAMPYALGDDQVMFYKMHRSGLKVLTWYGSGVVHLDAGQNLTPEKAKGVQFADVYFKTIFWHRFLYRPERNPLLKAWCALCFGYFLAMGQLISLAKGQLAVMRIKRRALREARAFLQTATCLGLPQVK